MTDLRAFLWPESIAVIGASPDPARLGGRLFASLVKRGFPGRLYPVTPTHSEVQGFATHASIGELPEAVDLALVIVRAELVAGVLEACAASGVKGAAVFSSGFAEAGGDYGAMQQEIAAVAERTGLLVAGPNAEGFYNAAGKVAATFSPTMNFDADLATHSRALGVVAQSGGVGFAIFQRALAKRLDATYVVSTGNEACLEALDFADFMLGDEATRVIAMFVEGLRDGNRFAEVAARAADLAKPLIVAKVGRSEAAARAAASHTASLAGSARAFDAVAARHGVVRADDPDEIGDIAAALAAGPLPAGRRVGIVTTSGGSGVWLADSLARAGLEVPELGPETRAEIAGFIPHYGATGNPVDITAQGVPTGGVFKAIDLLAAGDEVDMVVVAAPLASEVFIGNFRDDFARVAAGVPKPILFYAYALPAPVCLDILAGLGIHCFTSLSGVAEAARALADYGDFQRQWKAREPRPLPTAPDLGGRLAVDQPSLCEYQTAEILAAYGVALPPWRLAPDAAAAVAAAAEIGYPVALKVQSPDLAHKTEAGALALGLEDAAAVEAAWRRITEAAKAAAPDAAVHGVLVQAMCPPGREMIAGIANDPGFGPLVLVGIGGIHAEALDDVALAPAPLILDDARAMIAGLRGAKLLGAWRGAPPADTEALAELLVTLSDMALHHQGKIAELDLNPVIVYAAGQGLRVVDGLILRRV